MLFVLSSCKTPTLVVYSDSLLYFGIYHYEKISPHEQVEHVSFEGCGLGVGLRDFKIGYQSVERTKIIPVGSFEVTTPIVDFKIGRVAEEAARKFKFEGDVD